MHRFGRSGAVDWDLTAVSGIIGTIHSEKIILAEGRVPRYVSGPAGDGGIYNGAFQTETLFTTAALPQWLLPDTNSH